jgi:dihydroneopterin aldolase
MSDEMGGKLERLRDEYTAAVNAAIEENRFDLVERLADAYPDHALELMAAG